jgi:hypothetical protein
MTALASFITSSAACRRALSTAWIAPSQTASVRSLDLIDGLDARTTDILDGIRQIVRDMPSRRPHSDPAMFPPERRARNIAMSCLAAHSEARRGDLKPFDGYLVEMKSRIAPTREALDAVDALNAKRKLLRMATDELGKLLHAVAENDMSSVEDHRRKVEEIAASAIPGSDVVMALSTFEYLKQRSIS